MGVSRGASMKKMAMLKGTTSITAGDANVEFHENFAPQCPLVAGNLPGRKRFVRKALVTFLSLTAWSDNAGR